MALLIRNQQNNWAYVLIVVLLTAAVGGVVIFYSIETINEIDALSSTERYLDKSY
jgi:uncharacterized integral membrane protein